MRNEVVTYGGGRHYGRTLMEVAANLQFFASMDDVIAANADAFGEGDTTKESFTAVSDKLKELGYDVLIKA